MCPDPQDVAARLTQGHLLGGKLRYTQPAEGFRSGIEPVVLAAAIPARPGQAVLEAGSGAGAALLCLVARVPVVQGYGVEKDISLARLANANARDNGFTLVGVIPGDITGGRVPVMEAGAFDHAFANPPYHAPAGTASPMPEREQAKRGTAGLLERWAQSMAKALRHRGTLTFILPATSLPECLDAMAEADCTASAVLPLWPKQNQPAKLVLVRGVKGGRTPLRLLPGLVLHEADGRFTPAAESILSEGAPLDALAKR